MRMYHYVGDAAGTIDGREGNLLGLGLGGSVRTRLLACEECGAVVPDGRGREQHERWHLALTSAVGHMAVPIIR